MRSSCARHAGEPMGGTTCCADAPDTAASGDGGGTALVDTVRDVVAEGARECVIACDIGAMPP